MKEPPKGYSSDLLDFAIACEQFKQELDALVRPPLERLLRWLEKLPWLTNDRR